MTRSATSNIKQESENTVTVPSPAPLSTRNLSKSFQQGGKVHPVLTNVSLSVSPGELLCVTGPSGTGKTTLIRCLSGLDRPDSGDVEFEGSPITGPPEGLTLVMQDYSRSLLPWMKVGENVALPMRLLGWSKARRRDEAIRVLDSVGLRNVENLYPRQLSGGMQQRVAIARAFIQPPKVLLMDEPFASVDAQTRFALEDLTLRLLAQTGVAGVLVTHDIDEAVYLGDRIIVLTGRPATVTSEIVVSLDKPRTQISTRQEPEFVKLRSELLERVLGA